MTKETLNSYQLSRMWFDWSFENPERVNPNHSALYFFCIEHCNRLGWKDKFGLPTTMAKEAIGIKNYRTYIKTLNELVDFGFLIMIEKSKNQYSANIVALAQNTKALTKALDKALLKHCTKQGKSIGESIASVDKPITNNNKPITIDSFDLFWNSYDKKQGREDCFKKFSKLSESDRLEILEHTPKYVLSTPDKKYRKNPETYLNGKHWQDEIEELPEPKLINKSNDYIRSMLALHNHDNPENQI